MSWLIRLGALLFLMGFTGLLQAQPGDPPGGGSSTGGGDEEPDEWGYYTAGGQTVTIPRSVLNKRGCLDVKKPKVTDECPNIQSTSCPATSCWTTKYYCVAFTIPPGPGDSGPAVEFEIDVLDTTSSFDNYPEVGYNVEGVGAKLVGDPVICYRTTECKCKDLELGFEGECIKGTKQKEYIIRQYAPDTNKPKCTKATPPIP